MVGGAKSSVIPALFEQPEQSEQREQSEQSEQSEQYEQPEQSEQLVQSSQSIRLSSAFCAASVDPQYSTEHLLFLASVIHVVIAFPPTGRLQRCKCRRVPVLPRVPHEPCRPSLAI